MITFFTDFGIEGPYLGQMRGVLHAEAPGTPVVDLMNDVPKYDIRAGAYLLPAVAAPFPKGTVFLCVVDPGVGGERRAVALQADGRWFVGPDNGLFELVARRATSAMWYEIVWRPKQLSASFHGRDVFAPAAAQIASAGDWRSWVEAIEQPSTVSTDWPDDLNEVIYIDGYGNCMTGIRRDCVGENIAVELAGERIPEARTFSDVEAGRPFCYRNALGLLEIAVNKGRADDFFGVLPGNRVAVRNLSEMDGK